MQSLLKKWISVAVAAPILGALFLFWPANLGGGATYVVTHGVSMEPGFHSDDLAILRPAPTYAPGEVVAYHGVTVSTLVLHRIIGGTETAFDFKGDNNSWVDPDHLPASAIVGRLWLRIPHGGAYLRLLHSPWLIGAIGLIVLTLTGEKTRRYARGRRKVVSAAAPPKAALKARALGAGAVALALMATGAAAYAFVTPTTVTGMAKVAITHKPTFSYDALTRPGVTYPDGHARTGQPIFLGLLRRLELTVGDAVTVSDGSNAGEVTAALHVTLANQHGWTTTIAETPARPVGAAGVVIPLDVPALVSRLAAVAKESGDPGGGSSGTVTIAATFATTGMVKGAPAPSLANAAFTMSLDPLQLRPAAPAADAGAPTLTTTVSVPTALARTVKVSSKVVAVSRLRAPAGLLAVLAWVLAAVFVARSRAPRHPTATVVTAIGARRVDVAELTLSASVIDVTSVASLVRIADRYDRLVLCQVSPAGSVFVVNDDGISYRLVVPAVGARHLRVA
ncbi:MAG: hypothetical protein QOH99_1000 [Frankiaceae bacterium]|nr:hypothetical protein [Frankiaceae bacterium]